MKAGYKVLIGIGVGMALAGTMWYFRKRIRKVASDIVDYGLSFQQEAYLKELHPKYANKFRQFIAAVQKETGYGVIITSGNRTFSKQDQLHKEDSRNPPAGHGYHNYGMAIDINATKGTQVLKKASPKEEWIKSGIPTIAKKMGFVWGGDFNGYYDPIHFDIRDYSDDDLRELAFKQFGKDPAKIQGNKVKLA